MIIKTHVPLSYMIVSVHSEVRDELLTLFHSAKCSLIRLQCQLSCSYGLYQFHDVFVNMIYRGGGGGTEETASTNLWRSITEKSEHNQEGNMNQ